MLEIRTGFVPRSSSARKLPFKSMRTSSSSLSDRAASRGNTRENSMVWPGAKISGAGTQRKPSRLPTESPTVPRSRSTPSAEARVYARPSALTLSRYFPGRKTSLTPKPAKLARSTGRFTSRYRRRSRTTWSNTMYERNNSTQASASSSAPCRIGPRASEPRSPRGSGTSTHTLACAL